MRALLEVADIDSCGYHDGRRRGMARGCEGERGGVKELRDENGEVGCGNVCYGIVGLGDGDEE